MSRPPRVRCLECAFEWFGATAAHGLHIVGSCPRCGGGLDFLMPVELEEAGAQGALAEGRTPASVLGLPLRR